MVAKKRTRSETEEPLMTLKDVAAYLQVAERTVYLWAQSGKIPSFKLGNVWRFQRQYLKAWFEQQKQTTTRKRA